MKEYAGKVRVFFRHYPLPFHQDAPLASQAALAAGAQGKFWEMHDKLFANQQALEAARPRAVRPGAGPRHGQVQAGAGQRHVQGRASTPTWRWPARSAPAARRPSSSTAACSSGAQPVRRVQEDHRRGDRHRRQADRRAGRRKAQVYAKLMAGAGTARRPGRGPPPPRQPPRRAEVYKVAVGDAADQGRQAAQGHHRRVLGLPVPVLQPGRSRPSSRSWRPTRTTSQVAFKHQPLPFHNNAEPAAMAAEAAHEQGKFWEMHDKLFANQQALDRPNLEKYAQELGLDMGQVQGGAGQRQAQGRSSRRDKAQASQFGATGTPTFFINGRKLRRRAARSTRSRRSSTRRSRRPTRS